MDGVGATTTDFWFRPDLPQTETVWRHGRRNPLLKGPFDCPQTLEDGEAFNKEMVWGLLEGISPLQ